MRLPSIETMIRNVTQAVHEAEPQTVVAGSQWYVQGPGYYPEEDSQANGPHAVGGLRGSRGVEPSLLVAHLCV